MGIVRTDESKRIEIEEFRRMLLACAAGAHQRKDDHGQFGDRRVHLTTDDVEIDEKRVCVTSGVSYLGIAIVNQLLVRGYSVRVLVHNEEDLEKLREMEMSGEMRGANNTNTVEAVMAKLTDGESLLEAFDGCRGVFHTAAFVDPAGLSGYSKFMAEAEVKATEKIMNACADAPSVRRCVLTSSLSACVWKDYSLDDHPNIIDHESWSEESVCITRKLWYALGKLRSERAAWQIAEERTLSLATICPGLITGPEFFRRNTTSTIAYLKGAKDMYEKGLLATIDVNRLAEAHVCVFEEMKTTAHGRYTCFDRVIRSHEEIENLARETEIELRIDSFPSGNPLEQFELSNSKLSNLMSRTRRCNTD